MESRIITLAPKKMVGMHTSTSLANDKTVQLWQTFMPRRKEVKNTKDGNFYSMQVYDPTLDFNDFNPSVVFEKWAAVEVSNYDQIPEGMETYDLAGGMYAVFMHKGTADVFMKNLNYIYGTWLPQSEYQLDNREHFEVLAEKYKGPQNPDSEEEIWIPIK